MSVDYKQIDWDKIAGDVTMRIGVLRAVCEHTPDGLLKDKIFRDLVLPNLNLLGTFCANIQDEAGAAEPDPASN